MVNTAVKHNIKTADIGGTASTTEFMRKVLEEIQIQTPEIGLLRKFLFLATYK